MFKNATYTFYSDTLGRSVVPDEDTFNRFSDDNKMFIKRLLNDGIVSEREENGIDIAVCRMIEIDYLEEQEAKENDIIASESINGYSYTYDNSARQKAIELNAKSTERKKIEIIKLYNDWNVGIM